MHSHPVSPIEQSPWYTPCHAHWRREIIARMQTARKTPTCKRAPSANSATPVMTAIRTASALLGIALLAAVLPARAQTCDSQPTQAQMVRANFQRVAKEGDFASTQDYAERAQRGLEQLAAQARRCGCAAAQSGFEEAAREMQRAKVAQSRKAVREVADRAATLFDAAMVEQKKCAGL